MVEQGTWFKDTIYLPFERILANATTYSHDQRSNTNDRLFIMRFFTFDNLELGPNQLMSTLPRVENLTDTFFKSFFFYKLKQNDTSGRTHGLFAQMKLYLSRDRSDTMINQMLSILAHNNKIIKVLPVNPHIPNQYSIMGYIQKIYGQKQNLLYKFVHVSDMIISNSYTFNSGRMSKVLRDLRTSLKVVLDNMISVPKTYPQSLLNKILMMTVEQFHEHMKFNTVDLVVQDVINDAYDIAIQRVQISPGQEQLLTDVMTKFSVGKSIQTERVEKQIQHIIRECFGEIFVHPSPFVKIVHHADIADHGVIDLLLFDYRFTMQLLLVSRWFARVCLQNPADIQNNFANLVLYGISGSGKSLILSALQKCIPTYTYLASGHFQNPDILSSALIYFGEFQSHQLVQSIYKDLFDIKSSIKVDFKNMHPENVSQNVPVILSTNDDVISILRSLPYKRVSHFHSNLVPVNDSSVQAALRRLYLIPMRYGQYATVHRNVQKDHPHYQELSKYNDRLIKEPYLLERIFNTIVAFSFFQNDLPSMVINDQVKQYVKQVVDGFINTYFGQFYYHYANDIRSILLAYEEHMFTMDLNDTELAMHNSSACNKLGQFMRVWMQFNTASHSLVSETGNKVLTVDQLKTVSQPVMVYYLIDNDTSFKESIRAPSLFFLLLHSNIFSYLHATMGDLYNDEVSDADYQEVSRDQDTDAVQQAGDQGNSGMQRQSSQNEEEKAMPVVSLSRTESKFMESIVGANEVNKPYAYFPTIYDDPFFDDDGQLSDDYNISQAARPTLQYKRQQMSKNVTFNL